MVARSASASAGDVGGAPDDVAMGAPGRDRRVAAVWAKSDPYIGTVERWLPLWQHLDDTADVAGLLWDHWLAPSARQLISSCLPGAEDDARRLLVWLAGAHDLGKASPAFAVQGRELCADMEHLGLAVGAMVRHDRAKLRHEVASGAILDRWLARHTTMRPRRRNQLTCIVGGHHGTYPVANVVTGAERDQPMLLGTGAWIEVQDLLADRAAHRAGVTADWLDWSSLRLSQPAQMLITGVVVMADWIASSADLFPLLPYGTVPPIPASGPTPSQRAQRAWSVLALRPPWRPQIPSTTAEQLFADRFPALDGPPRPVQAGCVALAEEMGTPGLLLVEAPMGEGKTEAAMLAAEILAAKFGSTGCYWALPTQATSNAMFDRMLGWLERLPDPDAAGAQSVSLVHGKAFLNESLSALPFSHFVARTTTEAPVGRLTASVHEWFRGRKRSGLASFVAGTIDNVLFAALASRHQMLRHLGFAGKVVVIDEVHAADVFMSMFLERSLEWLAGEGVPVILLSATLPPERRAALYSAYESGRTTAADEAGSATHDDAATEVLRRRLGYPVLVASRPSGPVVRELQPSARSSQVTFTRLDDSEAALLDVLDERLAAGGCAVVIRNTVRRAQETAECLAAHLGQAHVTLAHAQYLAIDRLRNDAGLLRLFGPPGPETSRPPGPHVVVATQVVEQSLDVDFDLMITDLAPIDLMLQRTGRLHRHARARPIASAQCFVTGVDWASAVPTPAAASSRIYGRWPLYRSLAVLDERWDRAIAIPDDIPVLVDAAYAAHGSAPLRWEGILAEALAQYEADRDRRQSAAEAFIQPAIQRPGTSLYGGGRGSVGTVDEESPKSQGYVRDGGDSIEVVVVQRDADGQDLVPRWIDGGGEELPLRESPVPYPQALMLARCTLRLPFALSHGGIIDQVIEELERNYFPGWAQSPFLSGQLALVLDDENRATLAGHELHYDVHRGLEVARA